jgi:predicted N-acetyltransferase YhbS
VDDEGESEEEGEIGQVIHGYGPLLEECSFVAEDEGRLVGATLVTLSRAQALLRHVVVDPSMKRRGIGSFLITASDNALFDGRVP